jgi:hypothetical protein
MHRRGQALLALLILTTLTLGACGGSSGPSIADPKEIITRAVEAMQKAKTVHIDATVDGTLNPAFLGGQIGQIALSGTTAAIDADLAGKNLHMTAAVPALLNMTADVIVVGAATYTKISLSSDKYVKSTTAASAPTDPGTAIAELNTFLAKPGLVATKKGDTSCGSKSCYAVEIDLSADELKTLAVGTDLGDATISLLIQVEKDTLYPAGITVTAKGSTLGDLTLKLTLSAWDKPVTVVAPPAAEVQ